MLMDSNGSVSLVWASMPFGMPLTNFGDALSPIVVSAISGRRVKQSAFRGNTERLSAIGTIAHNFANGKVHIWGSGLDRSIDPLDSTSSAHAFPPDTDFVVHACRGANTQDVFERHGIPVTNAFGDPGWCCNKLWPDLVGNDPCYDLGIVLHLSEWESHALDARPLANFARYEIPETYSGRVCLINTITDRSVDGVRRVVERISRCRRILSTSLHGIVVAEALGIPAFFFGFHGQNGPTVVATDDNDMMDHRMRDLYSATGKPEVPAYIQARETQSNWKDILDWSLEQSSVLDFDPGPLFNRFPLEPVVSLDDKIWPVRADFLDPSNTYL